MTVRPDAAPDNGVAVERREAPGPYAKGLARLARRAGGLRQTRLRALRQRPGASRRSIPFLGKRKKGNRRVPRLKELGERSVGYLVKPELTVDRLEFGRLDQLAMRDLHRMQRAFQLVLPERQEAHQFGKFREQVI